MSLPKFYEVGRPNIKKVLQGPKLTFNYFSLEYIRFQFTFCLGLKIISEKKKSVILGNGFLLFPRM
jgi:hypothetical protein